MREIFIEALPYKRKLVILGLLVLTLGLLAACGASDSTRDREDDGASSGYVEITAEEGLQRMQENSGLILVDVRTEEEYIEKHIPGAILIPNETIGETPPELLPDKEAEVVVYCRSGRRSQEAAEKLLAQGYTNVKDMGGIQDWPYETVSGAEPGEIPVETDDAAGGAQPADSDEADGAVSDAEPSDAEPSFGNFKATDIKGNEIDQSIFADHKLTMINVWGTFCSPCLREMPELGEINREYEGKDFQIVGIVMDVLNQDLSVSEDKVKTAVEIVDETKADYLHLVPSEDLLYAGIASIQSVPFTFFVDEDGNLVGKTYLGAKSKSKWEKIIVETLELVQ